MVGPETLLPKLKQTLTGVGGTDPGTGRGRPTVATGDEGLDPVTCRTSLRTTATLYLDTGDEHFPVT